MIVIVGLGNPIPKYSGTRHNIGQAVLSYFQKTKNFPDFKFKKKIESLISEGKIDEEKIILVLPQTFMNESGRAIKKIIENWKLEIGNLIVIYDDIDLPLGKIRIRQDGSSGGHKGVQSIIDYLKTDNFTRIKIGIEPFLEKIRMGAFGLPKPEGRRRAIRVQKFVLEKFEKDEKEIVEKIIKKTCEIIEGSLKEKIKNQTFVVS